MARPNIETPTYPADYIKTLALKEEEVIAAASLNEGIVRSGSRRQKSLKSKGRLWNDSRKSAAFLVFDSIARRQGYFL